MDRWCEAKAQYGVALLSYREVSQDATAGWEGNSGLQCFPHLTKSWRVTEEGTRLLSSALKTCVRYQRRKHNPGQGCWLSMGDLEEDIGDEYI